MCTSLFLNPLIPLKSRANSWCSPLGVSTLYTRERKLSTVSCTRLDNSQTNQQQLNLSVLRFTLGIPGLDESYLPRWIGYAFGSLLLLNHFVGSDSANTTPAQLRSEALGLSLAGFSIVLPYVGKFLKGVTPIDQATVPEGAEQIFVMSQNIKDNVKEDLAWGTYVLLRNTNTISVLISVQDALCVRGYWNIPRDVSKVDALDWFHKQIQRIGLSDLKETLYFPQSADSELWEILPEGTRSLLVQPVQQAPKGSANQVEKTEGFVILASSIDYAYSDKDRAWIGAVANKFRGKSILADL
ncbi:Protein COFACTOR ASSEMBLY OF COMPLEX C SUBUNIT B like [Actinidia chinensis var. chinensis]|uniref:Protein COFACTOR ASSEMBLY OF COMPLEX C SUBUNIT B like n=1 Tax=Actinidia chinensis var. chinensis TaxID=1590841 RepID=A0A2R6PM38_ACTCC|nr:Protein COFACTOR ASSEMBLY OF COMPLEX C SUBUNIT B like [Actinidia chinensis var. chinensis]